MIRKCVILTAVLAGLSASVVGQYWEGDDLTDPTSWHVDGNWRDPAFVPDALYLETAAIDTANLPSPIISTYTNPLNVVVGWSTDLGTCQPKIVAGGELFLGSVDASNSIYIGHDTLPGPAKGVLTLDGGAISNILDLYLGTVANAEGTFIMNSGTYTSTGVGAPRIGWGGKGTMTINGGTATTNYLQLGINGGSNGTLNVNGGTLTVTTNGLLAGVVAGNAIGTLNQTGGTITVTATVVDIASAAGTSATFNLSGGTFNYNGGARYAVGFGGSGVLNFSGSAVLNIPSGNLRLAQQANSTGVVNMTGGTMNLATLTIGHNVANSSATFNLWGGTVNCSNNATIQAGKGTMDIRDGVLIVTGNRTGNWNGYVTDGYVTAWGGRATVNVVYDSVANKTTISSSPFTTADLLYAWGQAPTGDIDLANKNVTLTWEPGSLALNHRIYLGTDKDVLDAIPAGSTSHVYYLGQTALGAESFGPLALNGRTTYFWRVDEVNSDATITKGKRWEFTVLSYTLFDNFEAYADTTAMTNNWGSAPLNAATLIKQSEVAWRPEPLDNQAMKLAFDNTASPFKTEVSRSYATPVNLSAMGIKALYIAFHGTDTVASPAGPLYVKLTDNSSVSATVNYPTTADLWQYLWDADWRIWKITLTDFAGVNMSQLKTITLGVGNGTSAGTAGTVYFDNIRAYVSDCWREFALGDFESNDCIGDMEDIEALSRDWGKVPYVVNAAATEPTDYILYYSFEPATVNSAGVKPFVYSVTDSGDAAHAAYFMTDQAKLELTDPSNIAARGFQTLDAAGGIGGSQCLVLNDTDNKGLGLNVASNKLNAQIADAATVSLWLKGDSLVPNDSQAFVGAQTIDLAVQPLRATGPNPTGVYGFKAGPGAWDNEDYVISYDSKEPSEFKDQWNHLAFTRDAVGVQRIYLNGKIVAEQTGNTGSLAGINFFSIGGRPQGGYNSTDNYYWRANDNWAYSGKVDDFKIYSRALTHAEVLRLAKGAGGSVTQNPVGLRADANADNTVGLADLEALVDIWLAETLWP